MKKSPRITSKRISSKCYQLNQAEMISSTILEQDFWLTDGHIDHAQWLLQQRFAGCKGLHSVLAFEAKPLHQQGSVRLSKDKWTLFKSSM